MDSISVPPGETPAKSMLPEQVTEPVLAEPDTGINSQGKITSDYCIEKE